MDILLNLLIAVIVFGTIWYIINLIPVPPPIKQIVQVVLGAIALIWLLNLLFHFAPGLGLGYH